MKDRSKGRPAKRSRPPGKWKADAPRAVTANVFSTTGEWGGADSTWDDWITPPDVPAANANPNQPRVPKGSSRGGEFASGKASSAAPPTLASLTESMAGLHGPERVRAAEKVLKRYSAASGPVRKHDMTAPEDMRHVTLDGVRVHYPDTPEGLKSAAITLASVTEKPVPPALWRSQREIVHTSQTGRDVSAAARSVGLLGPDGGMHAGATGGDGDIVSYSGRGLARDTLTHEAGHNAAFKVWGTHEPPVWSPYGAAQRSEPPVSAYARANASEDFAEAVRMYASGNPIHLYELRSKTPRKHAALAQMFGGVE